MNTYVAELQLHMALQARNLVPDMTGRALDANPCNQLIQQAQAAQEITFSRRM
jgi:uncharacterized membrane-anchored protein YhcB (DUF1043 family)